MFLTRTLRNLQFASVSWEKTVQDEIQCPALAHKTTLDKDAALDENPAVPMNPAPLSTPQCRTGLQESRGKNRSLSRSLSRSVIASIACGILCGVLSGCGALLLVGGAGTSAIAFATGELQSTEAHSLDTLDGACALALDEMAYSEIDVVREADRIRWRAKTSGGDPVDLRLQAKGPQATDLRIRIGVFGNESRSRLLLEQIHQSL